MTSIKREAIRDADEYAMAKMFFGEGAGVRRRLINQTVQFKMANIPGYDMAFQKELAKQDFAKLSRKARRERKLLDARKVAGKNGRALVRGDYRSMSLPLLVLAGAGYLAHEAGYDKKALEFGEKKYRETKAWVERKRTAAKQK